MKRRAFVTGLGAVLAAPFVAHAQPVVIRRIGVLAATTPDVSAITGFREGLKEQNYVEGRSLLIEWRFAEGNEDRLTALAVELVRLKVEVIVTVATTAALAAKKATRVIPIVFTAVGDPVGSGVVTSLARPEGNLTGFTNLTVEATGKRLALLKEAMPSLKSIVMLNHRANPVSLALWDEARMAAARLSLEIRRVDVTDAKELQPSFRSIRHLRNIAVVLMPGSFLSVHRREIAKLSADSAVPVIGWDREWITAGVAFSYGPSNFDIGRRAVGYVTRILAGATPRDLPIEQPTKFELLINLKTTKALGLTIPPSLLLRADQVIE